EVREQLSILVLSIQSFASNKKEGRKVFQENENLVSFTKDKSYNTNQIEDAEDTALIQVIANLNPVVIIDESHNYESNLRLDLLNLINPSFILDLTATPREKSNIISFVDAMKLKVNNMVKLPVIVYKNRNTEEVISNAIQFQKKLEEVAIENEKETGLYIRPIVLFQAQPKTDDDNVTFDKIKQQLIEAGIPENQIKIKTSKYDEIKNIDLLSKDCEIRFIITINALKEGWDCPFAYILASLANKTSNIDVEQILGRILRLPHVTKHSNPQLNASYVFSSSSDFQKTLENIIKALNRAGFSKKDYRYKEEIKIEKGDNLSLIFDESSQKSMVDEYEVNDEIDVVKIKKFTQTEASKQLVDEFSSISIQQIDEYEKNVEELIKEDQSIPTDIIDKVKTSQIKDSFKDDVKGIKLPSFYVNSKNETLFNLEGELIPLCKNYLSDGFNLSLQDKNINLTITSTDMAKIDLKERVKDEYVPQYQKMSASAREGFVEYFKGLTPQGKKNKVIQAISRLIGNINEIPQPHIICYVSDIVSKLDADKIDEIANDEYGYSQIIRHKIEQLVDKYTKDQFYKLLDLGSIKCEKSFAFPKRIIPKNGIDYIQKNLYTEEDSMNEYEKKVISQIAELDNVVFWHRNLNKGKGFMINGFMNHYPDFIVKLKNGKIIVIETKGDYLDNTDSKDKIKLGNTWAVKAGENYRYYMVFENNTLDGAKNIRELIDIIKNIQ
ncbi:MAG: DEAD/DEAH box helicase family protein, partial [Bacteroidales bacterium]